VVVHEWQGRVEQMNKLSQRLSFMAMLSGRGEGGCIEVLCATSGGGMLLNHLSSFCGCVSIGNRQDRNLLIFRDYNPCLAWGVWYYR
jgi:hypothetical protein